MRQKIGKTRESLPGILVKAFAEIGITARFDAKHLRPATGHWRTSVYADVYRWEGSGEMLQSDGSWITISVDSWDTMTDCVHHGCTVLAGRPTVFDASANKTRIHPVILRAAKRAESRHDR